MQTSLPLASVAGYPSFLSAHSTDGGVLFNDPLDAIGALRPLDRFTASHRSSLVDALEEDLRRWGAPATALASAAQLREESAYAVVTGQQAGIAGGPLYTLYKAIGAVRAAERLADLHPGKSFVPVFWIEADDHDFEEVSGVTLPDRAGNVVTLRYDDGDARALHIGDRIVDAGALDALEAALREALQPTDFTDAALGLISSAYGGDGATLADGFARTLYALLGDTPLVLLSSRNADLKKLAADVIACEAAEPGLLFDAVSARTGAMAERGLPTPIAPKPGSLFITHEGERRSLDPVDGGYAVRGTDITMTHAEAAAMARSAPERFSPKVALRPLVQDAILPTALYLGGPSEVTYLDQLRDAYPAFDLAPSAVAPRPFVLLLEGEVSRAVERAGITLGTLLAEGFDAASMLVDGEIIDELEERKERALQGIASAFGELEEITKRIDPTLEKSLGAATAAASKGAEDLAKRLASALRKKQGTDIDRLNGARAMVMPLGELQERTLGMLYFINKYGLEKFREALAAITIEPGMLQVIEVGGEQG
jgi:bacillithiol biosynthesis cysteine-adding enzyme BshC